MLWLPQLRSSLWLDETFTYWAIKDGFLQALERGHRYPPSRAAYFAVAWLFKDVGGTSEWVLRLPSVIAAALAVFMLIRIGTAVFDRETGWIAGILLATNGAVAFAASDARPYALALLTVIAAVYFLAEWVRTEMWYHAIAYAALSTASVYLQRLFAIMYLVHALYLWRAWRTSRRPSFRALGGTAILIAVLLLPLAVDILSLAHQREGLSWSSPPSLPMLAAVCVSPVVVFGLLVGFLIAPAVDPTLWIHWQRTRTGPFSFLLAWALAPPIVLFVVSVSSAAHVFVDRYALQAVPGFCLLVAYLIRCIEPARARRILAEALVFVSVLGSFGTNHGGEDWRAAIAEARRYIASRPMPVLLRSGTFEEHDVDWLLDPEKREVVLAPLAYSRLDADVIPLPWNFDSQAQRDYMERVASDHLMHARSFLLINRIFGDNGNFASWLGGRFEPLGFCSRSIGNFGQVEALVFDRDPGACSAAR